MAKQAVSLGQNAEWMKENARLAELQTELATLASKSEKLQAGLNDTNFDRLTREAKTLLNGSDLQLVVAARDLEAIGHQREVVARAIDLQKRVVANARYKASAAICAGLLPEYRGLVREVARAAILLARAAEKEEAFMDHLKMSDIAFASHLTPVIFRCIGRLSDPYSPVSHFLAEAEEFGLIAKETLL